MKRTRILITIGVLFAFFVGYTWFFGFATLVAAEGQYVGWKLPVVRIAPVALTDLSLSSEHGRRLSYFGYELDVPWPDVDEQKLRQIGKLQLIPFRSGRSILFSTAPPREFVEQFLSSDNDRRESLQKLYGDDALKSDYSLKLTILDATPGRVGVFSSRRDAVANSMLLVYKGIMLPRGAESGIFLLSAGEYRGFQFGNPATRPKVLWVEMYCEHGGFSFMFSQWESEASPAITQAEINHLIQSTRKLPD